MGRMTESMLLHFFLGVAFVLAPLMTNHFFLNNSKRYSDAHKSVLMFLLIAACFGLNYFVIVWPLFCAFGLLLYLAKQGRLLFSINGVASSIPFLFSLISATWFFAGVNDLHLLGYNRAWSFYAALHGSFLGWIFVGGLAFLAQRPNAKNKLYLFGCYLSLILFLCVAFGIDGIPYVKRMGVVGLSLMVPILIGIYAFNLKKSRRHSRFLSILSLCSVIASMTLALLNEFWLAAPRAAFGIPVMVFAHGFLNAILTIPCFYLAIRFEDDQKSEKSAAQGDIIFFDGFCVLCSGTVALLIKIDKKRIFQYSSLQGKYAQQALNPNKINSGASVVFLSNAKSYERAEAVIHILKKLGLFYKLLGILLSMFPLFGLNPLYDLIARHRYRIFGKNDACLIPKETERNLFIS